MPTISDLVREINETAAMTPAVVSFVAGLVAQNAELREKLAAASVDETVLAEAIAILDKQQADLAALIPAPTVAPPAEPPADTPPPVDPAA